MKEEIKIKTDLATIIGMSRGLVEGVRNIEDLAIIPSHTKRVCKIGIGEVSYE